MRLVVDLDDVMTRTTQRIMEVFVQFHKSTIVCSRTEIDFKSMFPEYKSEYISEFVWDTHKTVIFDIDTMPYVPELPKFLKQLKHKGIELILGTANPIEYYVQDFVAEIIYPSYEKFLTIEFTLDKHLIKADAWIDDDPRILEKLDFNKKIFVKDMPYNRDFKQGIRISSLLECLRYL